jgi:hypothetical protein
MKKIRSIFPTNYFFVLNSFLSSDEDEESEIFLVVIEKAKSRANLGPLLPVLMSDTILYFINGQNISANDRKCQYIFHTPFGLTSVQGQTSLPHMSF